MEGRKAGGPGWPGLRGALPPTTLPGWLGLLWAAVSHTRTHPTLKPELPEDPIPSLAEMMVGGGGSLGAAESHQARGGTEGQPELGIGGRRRQIAACGAVGP